MTVTITSLNWREKVTPPVGPWPAVPYLIVNVTWRVEPGGDDDEGTHKMFLGATEDYQKVLTVDDPKQWEEYLAGCGGLDLFQYPGLERRYTLNDKKWRYIPKFDTFWLREWIVDSPVTRAILKELEVYKRTGKLESVYRGTDSHILYNHFETLNRYWD
jgi:hypothetical protein